MSGAVAPTAEVHNGAAVFVVATSAKPKHAAGFEPTPSVPQQGKCSPVLSYTCRPYDQLRAYTVRFYLGTPVEPNVLPEHRWDRHPEYVHIRHLRYDAKRRLRALSPTGHPDSNRDQRTTLW